MWIYENKEFTDIGDYIGFVYIITNTVNGRRYIGKKNFYFSKTRQVKGKKKKYKAESDWRDYYGSNAELLADVEKYGKENFKREILRLCMSKGEMTYMELREQMDYRVLESNMWYNAWVYCRVRKPNLKKIVF